MMYEFCHPVLPALSYCEAQGKGRARGGPRKVTQRSFMDGGWWIVDILSLMLYIKFGEKIYRIMEISSLISSIALAHHLNGIYN